MADEELLSMHLSKILDNLGYSHSMAVRRRAAYQEYDITISSSQCRSTHITAGSKGEGITKPFESDKDILCIPTTVVCLEKALEKDVRYVHTNTSIFTMKTSYPGYAILTFTRLAPLIPDTVKSSLVPSGDGQYFLSSEKVIKHFIESNRHINIQTGYQTHDRAGPAAPSSKGMQEIDRVYSLRCFCPSILNEWLMRPRQYDWPPLQLRYTIVQSEANLVAKGFTESEMKHLEWRICFNRIELLLIHSLNEIHLKLYILLKMILKDILQPKQKEITSYVLKNIVFWLAEMNPIIKFQEKYLLRLLMKAIRFLRIAIKTQHLPYYMIPDRNLLVDKMSPPLRHRLLKRVSRLLEEGPCLLLRVKKLTVTARMSYYDLRIFGAKRDELEMLHLTFLKYQLSLLLQGISGVHDEILRAYYVRIWTLLHTDWPLYLQEKFRSCGDEYERMQHILC